MEGPSKVMLVKLRRRITLKTFVIIVSITFLCLFICIYTRINSTSPPSKPQNQGQFKTPNPSLPPRKSLDQVKIEMEWLNRGKSNQDSSELVHIVREYYLFPPSTEPYNLNISQRSSTDGQGQLELLAPILKKLTPGSFIECGAFDGEYLSNSLWLEKELGWNGLLIEADPKNYQELVRKNRKAWQSNTCLSRFVYPEKLSFQRHPLYPVLTSSRNLDRITSNQAKAKLGPEAKAEFQCVPLYTFFLALNQFTWDFFSLDTEGSELEILKTIPFDRVIFKIITIEANLIPEGLRGLNEFMFSQGYKFYKDVHVDRVYIHSSFWKELVEA